MKTETKTKILDVALSVIRVKGDSSTEVDDLCESAARHWSEATSPLERVLGYIDFRKLILRGKSAEFTCLVGTMVQEAFASNPAVREAPARARGELGADESGAAHPGGDPGIVYYSEGRPREAGDDFLKWREERCLRKSVWPCYRSCSRS